MLKHGIFCDGCSVAAGPADDPGSIQKKRIYDGWTTWVSSETGQALDFCGSCTSYRSSYGKRPELSEINVLSYDLTELNDEEYRYLLSIALKRFESKKDYDLSVRPSNRSVRVRDVNGQLWIVTTAGQQHSANAEAQDQRG